MSNPKQKGRHVRSFSDAEISAFIKEKKALQNKITKTSTLIRNGEVLNFFGPFPCEYPNLEELTKGLEDVGCPNLATEEGVDWLVEHCSLTKEIP